MALRDKLRKLEKNMRGTMGSFELADGTRFFFDRQEAFSHAFLFFSDSMTADHKCEPRPDPPYILQAVAGARNRADALSRAISGYSHLLPIDREALIERGEFVPRSLVAGVEYEDLGVLEDLSE
jgi:hypothetical protein